MHPTFLAAGPSPLWFATRAGGTIALILLTATVVLGITVGGQYAPKRIARFEISALHRNLSLLTLAFLVLHVLTTVADTYVNVTLLDVVLPFASSYRTLWLGLGTVAFDLLLAVLLTTAVRLRLGVRRWKTVHWLGYASWPVALFHAAGTGTDTKVSLQLLLYAACLLVVLAAVWWRLYRAGPGRLGMRLAMGAASALVPVVLIAFLTTGPLQPDWAQRASGAAPHAAPTTHQPASADATDRGVTA
ncbi:ferric reductase-like transmembrane domain-containing protein [Streptomyces sp. NPDC001796]|uniref:ferric reductase-like transmembrane domain-containing protein n=1 Tax=Streptomyces sp. NPDC001796 TaxID=3364609 RepID=UPI00368B6BBF